jgi:isoquinoline 1-oxidoreductase alpha subunit
MKLTINGTVHTVKADPDTPLLWVLREELKLTGTKFGCGIAQCGACTVHLDGKPVRSCVLKVADAAASDITTIEGLAQAPEAKDGVHPVQAAWRAENVPQCGYCQSGQIMSTVALLRHTPKPSRDDIDMALSGNVCRCGTYVRIRKAVKRASEEMA